METKALFDTTSPLADPNEARKPTVTALEQTAERYAMKGHRLLSCKMSR